MKRNLIYFLLASIVLSGGAGYFYYTYFYKSTEIDGMSLVPESAIAVYEVNNSIHYWNFLEKKNLWASLYALPGVKQINNSLTELDSLTDKSGRLDQLLSKIPLLISLHQTAKGDVGYTYYFRLKDLEDYDIVEKVIDQIQSKSNIRIDSRTYLGEKINEVTDTKAKITFSYIIYKDHFAGSFHPILLEDVIRNIENDGTSTFYASNEPIFNVKGNKGDDVNIYLNAKKINSLVSVFSNQSKVNDAVALFAEGAKLNLEVLDHDLFINGYTLAGKGSDDYYLSTFKGQDAGAMRLRKYIPNRTATLLHFTFHDGTVWYNNLASFWDKKVAAQAKRSQQFLKEYELEPSKFLKWMGGEVGLATLQSMDIKKPDKLVIIKTNDIHEAFNQMNKLASKADLISGDSLFKENFSDIDIRQLNIDEFPAVFLGSHFSGFSNSFYSVIDDYIIIGNSLQVMKSLITDIDADNVWGKSVTMSQYFEGILGNANLGFFVNTERAWGSLVPHLNEKWKPLFSGNSPTLKNFKMLGLQFSNSGDRFYTAINIKHQDISPKDKEIQNFNFAPHVAVDAPIITKPYYLKSVGEKEFHILFQDSLFNLYKISPKGEVLWKENIGEKILGDIHQIDYLKNGQLQYVFYSLHAVHVLSSEGSYINNNFPHSFVEPISFMTVVDYDNSKNYRFLFATANGDLYMMDKQMEALEGWNPRKLGSKPACAPMHIRVRGKDFLVSLQESGLLNVMNRRGDQVPGFPLNLQGSFSNNIFVQPGPTIAQTILTILSQKGEIIKLNLEGKIIKKEQLYRPSRETRFVLCIDEFQKNYIIARQQLGILTLLDAKGEVILEKDYITSGALEIQYFNAGIEKEIYAVTDKIQEFTYLYDYKGSLINSRPIDSGHKIGLNYAESSGNYEVIANYDTQFSRISFAR